MPTERELAERFHVSRGVINRGLIKLANDGFISIVPRVGSYVNNYIQRGNIHTVTALMNFSSYNFSDETLLAIATEVKSLIEIKGAIDTLTVSLIGNTLQEDDYCELSKILEKFENNCNCNSSCISNNCVFCTEYLFEFYSKLCEISGNTITSLMYNSFKQPISNLWARYLKLYTSALLKEHARAILNALHNKAPESAIAQIHQLIIDTTVGTHLIY